MASTVLSRLRTGTDGAEITEMKDDKKLYEQFVRCLKLGAHEDSTNCKKGLKVLCMMDPVDEYCVLEPEDKKLKSTTKEGLDLEDEGGQKKFEKPKAAFEPLIMMKEVPDLPCVLTTSEDGWSANMETYHEGSGFARQFDDVLHGLQED